MIGLIPKTVCKMLDGALRVNSLRSSDAYICVDKLTIIGSDNGLSPGQRQAIIWTNYGIVLITYLGTNCNAIPITIHTFSFKKIHLKMSSRKWRPFCPGLNELTNLLETRAFIYDVVNSHFHHWPRTSADLWQVTQWFPQSESSIKMPYSISKHMVLWV